MPRKKTKPGRGRPARTIVPSGRVITMRASPEEYDRVRAYATAHGITISEAMRRCIFSAQEVA